MQLFGDWGKQKSHILLSMHIRRSTRHIQQAQLSFTRPSWTSPRVTRFPKDQVLLCNYFVTGEDEKSIFLLLAILLRPAKMQFLDNAGEMMAQEAI
jgi:hypothetical protein